MGKLKIESIDSKTFKLGGLCFAKGQYMVQYSEVNTDENGDLTSDPKVFLLPLNTPAGATVKSPFKEYQPYTNFLDSAGDPFADFDTFTEALVDIITPAGGSGSIPTLQEVLDASPQEGEAVFVTTPIAVGVIGESYSIISSGALLATNSSGNDISFDSDNGVILLATGGGGQLSLRADNVAVSQTQQFPNSSGNITVTP